MAEGSRRRRLSHDEGSATERKRKKLATEEEPQGESVAGRVTRTAGEDGEEGEGVRCDVGEEGEGEGVRCEDGEEGEGVRYGYEFFDQPCADLARAMLGCVLVCRGEGDEECRGEGGEECRGRVVEVEAYLGGEDRAAHSYNGRRSKANQAMYMAPGTAYVYSIYGMHSCFNVSSRGEGAAVLVRALQPVAGLETMQGRRGGGRGRGRGGRKESDLCSGPGKLCQAMAITKQHNQMDLVTSPSLWLERGEPLSPELVSVSPRVGIDYAGPEWASAPLRFFQTDSPGVSRPRARRRQDKPS